MLLLFRWEAAKTRLKKEDEDITNLLKTREEGYERYIVYFSYFGPQNFPKIGAYVSKKETCEDTLIQKRIFGIGQKFSCRFYFLIDIPEAP